MYELMIAVSGGSWMYFRTDQACVDKAWNNFLETMDNNGCDVDNVNFVSAELRDNKGHEIDTLVF